MNMGRFTFEQVLDNIYTYNDYDKGYTHSLTVKDDNISEFIEEVIVLLNKLDENNKYLKKELDNTIEMLHKEITTSEYAFDGLMKENKELRSIIKNYETLPSFKKRRVHPDGKGNYLKLNL